MLGDALSSVRLVVDESGAIVGSKSYQPYGELTSQWGVAGSSYGFTGEQTDPSGLVYLRARYYDPASGRFLSRDRWAGDRQVPMSYNHWLYGYANPQMYTDPTGLIAQGDEDKEALSFVTELKQRFGITIVKDWGMDYFSTRPGIPPNTGPLCIWQEGKWNSPHEVELVINSLEKISIKFGGDTKVRSVYSGYKIVKHKGGFQGYRSWVPPFTGTIILTDYGLFDRKDDHHAIYTIIHEFGHAWDWRTNANLSHDMAMVLGTWNCSLDKSPNCSWDIDNNPEAPPGTTVNPYAATHLWEDWAEAFANTIYPDYYASQGYVPLGPIRKKYVEDHIAAIP